MPQLKAEEWHKALHSLPSPLRQQLNTLKKSEKAHILRVYKAIHNDASLSPQLRDQLETLALLHDIGKSVTRHSIFFKVAKVLLPIANSAHCVAGARFLRVNKVDRDIIRRVLRHHDSDTSDEILKKFQSYDDRL